MLHSEKYQHLFFDLDHTLWDFEANSAQTMFQIYDFFQFADKNIDKQLFQKRYSYHNFTLWEQLEKGLITRAEVRVNRFLFTLQEFGINDFELAKKMGDVYLQILPTQTLLFDGAMELIEHVHPKYQLHIITNGFVEVQYKKLANCGLDKFFTKIITSEEAEANKPEKKIFDFAFKLSGANASNSLMIGDNPFADMQGALNAGMDRVLFNTMQYKHDVPITVEIKSLRELMKWL